MSPRDTPTVTFFTYNYLFSVLPYQATLRTTKTEQLVGDTISDSHPWVSHPKAHMTIYLKDNLSLFLFVYIPERRTFLSALSALLPNYLSSCLLRCLRVTCPKVRPQRRPLEVPTPLKRTAVNLP